MRSAEEIAERARGKYKPEYITQTNSVAVPIIERLSSEEQLHFVFFHENKGFRIFEPDGKERTPDHTSITGTTNKRFFLVTDERILYIVGEDEEADDKIQEFSYDNITSVEGYESKGASIIEFSTKDGRRYKFVNNAWQTDTVQNAAKYINSQVDSTATEGSEEPAQGDTGGANPEQETTAPPETRFCPDCGAEVTADDAFCSECGNSVEQLGSSAGTDESKSTGANASEVEMSSTDRVEDIQKQEDRNEASEPTTQSDTEESDELDIDWTLSFVVGLFMSVSSILLGFYYTFAAGNLASGILFWLAGSAGGNYITGNWNISRWLAVVIFLLLWMTGSFLIGTGAA
ncbi:PH domain-containing protein [Halobellus clavatus]|uniref:Zinc-ribbon domain-containing protein n=1 Tax=Halobellus clavatus TaxID=660517 RepID=A0A1H3GKG8_9EURY|nr:PH domain-containing protein [Halobellus clavatus]SDY03842.1 zinc-ribbon domain-containing protein [Halobellus clavatus]